MRVSVQAYQRCTTLVSHQTAGRSHLSFSPALFLLPRQSMALTLQRREAHRPFWRLCSHRISIRCRDAGLDAQRGLKADKSCTDVFSRWPHSSLTDRETQMCVRGTSLCRLAFSGKDREALLLRDPLRLIYLFTSAATGASVSPIQA